MKKNKQQSKMFDLFNIKEWEVKWSIVTAFIIFFILMYLDFYKEFSFYEEAIKNLIGDVFGALVGLLGFALSGIAIIVSLFSTKEAKMIEQLNGSGKIIEILESYSFLAKNTGVQCFVLLIIYFAIFSNHLLLCSIPFHILLFIEIYHIVFIIWYTVALVKNCIELYKIKTIYSKIKYTKKSIHDTVNEVKIDFIFSTLINNYGCTEEEVISNLIAFVEESQLGNKEKVIKYIKQQYEK